MNKILVEDNKFNNKDLILEEDTIITYINSNITLDIEVLNDIKVFEYIKDSKININYNLNNNLVINRFSSNSSVSSVINLDKENIKLDYNYSNINVDDNSYNLWINHNKKNTTSNVNNNGINLESNKLNYVINGYISKESFNSVCNQDSKIILMKDNNSSIKPNLIIDNNEIEASHSSYIGYFDKEKLFYLNSRSLSKEEAQKLLVKAFLFEKMDISYLEKDLILKEINSYWR